MFNKDWYAAINLYEVYPTRTSLISCDRPINAMICSIEVRLMSIVFSYVRCLHRRCIHDDI